MVYRILVVEDEEIVRNNIIKVLNGWNRYELEIQQATNGLDGAAAAKALSPDIILTDIMMPGLDGLKMIAQIKAFLPKARYLILSGYGDFQFARDAIDLKVSSYLLKPFDDEELFDKLCMIIGEIDKEHEQSAESSQADWDPQQYQCLRDLLTRDGSGEIETVLKECQIDTSSKYYRCISLTAKRLALTDREFFIRSSHDFANHTLGIAQTITAYMNEEKTELAMLCASAKCGSFPRLDQWLEQYRSYMRKRFRAEVLIGVGGEVQKADQIPASFEQARCAMHHAFFSADGKPVVFSDALAGNNRYMASRQKVHMRLEQIYIRINASCRTNNPEETERLFSRMQSVIKSFSDMEMDEAAAICERLVFLLFTSASEFSGKDCRIAEQQAKQRLRDCATLSQMIEELRKTTLDIGKLMPDKSDGENHVIAKMKRIIEQEYGSGITLGEIANRLGYSQNYLGVLFNRITGRGFNAYMEEYRIEQAKKLLHETSLSMKQISELIGISDITYFSTLFKKLTGLTPSGYRKLNG